MPASSLVDICKKVCIKNVASLTDVGSLEYFQIKDVLEQVRHASQLREIELNSPQIKGENAELWRKFIAKEVPDHYKKNYSPKNPLKWYEVYCKYKREQAAEIKHDEEVLRAQMMGLQKAQESKVSRVIDLKQLPKVPRDPRMLANNGGVPLGKKGFKKDAPSSLIFSAGSKTKITDGKSVLTKARREAKEISAMGKISRPTHQLASLGRVAKAPAAMIKEYQTAAQPSGRPISSIKILSRKSIPDKVQTEVRPGGMSLEERESRLRALTAGGSKRDSSGEPKLNLVDFDDEEDPDDLFDEPSPPPQRPVLAASPPSLKSRPIAKSVKKLGVLQQLALPRPKTATKAVVKPVATTPQSASKPQQNPTGASTTPARQPQTYTPPPSLTIRKPSPPGSRPTTPTGPSTGPSTRKPSPPVGAPKPTMIMKRKPVDIFNRGPKKPRLF